MFRAILTKSRPDSLRMPARPGSARLAAGAGAALLLAAAPLVADVYYLNLLFMIGIYVMTCTGLNILVGYCGIVSIGHAGLMAAGAYVSAILTTNHGFSFWLAAAAGVAVSLVVGIVIAIPTIRAGGVYLSMITIAFGIVVSEVLMRWDSFSGGPLGISGIPKPAVGGYTFTLTGMYELVLFLAVISLLVMRNLRRSSWGRAMMASKENEIAAASLGIRKLPVQAAGFALSAVLAGLAGACYAHANSYISPDTFHFQTSVQLVLIVILGGAGRLIGPVIGAVILVFLPELLDMEKLRLALYGAIMFIVLYVMPKGIAGTIADVAVVWVRKRYPNGLSGGSWIGRGRGERGGGDGGVRGGSSVVRERGAGLTGQGASSSYQGPPLVGAKGKISLTAARVDMRFGGLHALRQVKLDVKPGTVHSLVGPNGAGKTTMLNVISGLYTPSGGEFLLDGARYAPRSLSHASELGIARTFQHSRLFKELTVLENVMTGMSSSGNLAASLLRTPAVRRREREMLARAHAYLDLIGYTGERRATADQLPYGYQRLVEIARALASSPRLLLLDEPAAGMTSEEIEQLESVLRKLRAQGLTIILIEHHMDFVQRVSDTITVLDFGEVIADGKPQDVMSHPRVIGAYLGEEAAVHADH
ncbi:ATP-binding cassette domain-containing protein [Paenibacillus sp. GCM10023252]|uniref:branched-chain amino acid ABC transporter ATP-binding protein/permease n=1 Tax=Paenibacillus sp. GCM10023252 TaxID=3252649 RepID=UPI0036222C56